MSNVLDQADQECDGIDHPCRAIEQILTPRVADLGGLSVRRVLPTARRKTIGPWIFFDEMGPAIFSPGYGVNVRPHPHIGLATVTYLFHGEILHRDSLGSLQPIRPGDINLMVAGRGIVHSERERPEVTDVDHRLHGLQLWLALPDSQEDRAPSFHHFAASEIPALQVDGVPLRVMMGSAYGVTSPVPVFSETLYLEAHLKAGQSLRLPDAKERGLYVASGGLKAQETNLPVHSMAVLSEQPGVLVTATEDSRIVVIGGDPVGKRYIEWNFVASSRQRIEQAKDDWRQGRFPLVRGDEQDFIPYP